MTSTDFLGNPVHAADEQEARAIDGFVTGFLGYTPRILEPLPLVAAGSTHPQLNIYAGWLWMFSESPHGFSGALDHLERARAGRRLTPREHGCATALECWNKYHTLYVDKYQGALFYAQIHGNTDKYIERELKVFTRYAQMFFYRRGIR